MDVDVGDTKQFSLALCAYSSKSAAVSQEPVGQFCAQLLSTLQVSSHGSTDGTNNTGMVLRISDSETTEIRRCPFGLSLPFRPMLG